MSKTIELTDKKWKIGRLLSIFLIMIGIGCCGMSNTNTGACFFIGGIVLYLISNAGRWWTNA